MDDWADIEFDDQAFLPENPEEEIDQEEIDNDVVFNRMQTSEHELLSEPFSIPFINDCNCLTVDCPQNLAPIFLRVSAEKDLKKFGQCCIDNITRALNFGVQFCGEIDNVNRMMICDNFYRARHEILFSSVCSLFFIDQEKSDVKFSEFGIQSERTPDYITVRDDRIQIIEVAAGSSIERMYMSKGQTSGAFESKYQKEIEMFRDIGIDCDYYSFLFEMSDQNNKDYMQVVKDMSSRFTLNKGSLSTLEFMRKELSALTLRFRHYLVPTATMLFSKDSPIKPQHPELDFLYYTENTVKGNEEIMGDSQKLKYTEFCISAPVYKKIVSSWDTLLSRVSHNLMEEGKRFKIVVTSDRHRIYTKEDNSGLSYNDFIEVIKKKDKISVLKNTLLKIGGIYKSILDSDTGVRFTDRVEMLPEKLAEPLTISSGHYVEINTNYAEYNRTYYESVLDKHFRYKYHSCSLDKSYEDKLIELITKMDKMNLEIGGESDYIHGANVNLLADNDLKSIQIDSVIDNLIKTQIDSNGFDDVTPLKHRKNKSPFILPMSFINSTSYTSLKDKNHEFLREVYDNLGNMNEYTQSIILNILRDDFAMMEDKKIPSSELREIMSKKGELSMQMSKITSEYLKTNPAIKKISKCTDGRFSERYKEISSELSKISKRVVQKMREEGVKESISFIRLPSKSKTTAMGRAYMNEMKHYKSKSKKSRIQSTIEGVGIRIDIDSDYNQDKDVFDNLSSKLTLRAGENPDLFFEDIKTEDCKLLKELKHKAVEEYETLIKEVTDSYLGHAAAFVSRMAHCLLYLSQMAYSSDYIKPDNLGYKDVMLLVKGGKKIYKTKCSKFFRLIYPVHEEALKWYETYKGEQSSSIIFRSNNGKNYIITPWVQLNESILNDSLSFYPRICSFSVLNSSPKLTFEEQFHKFSLNVMLAFHNRRQTEVLLANMRYILLSTLGDFTGIVDIFKEFLGFNYDCFQSFVRSSILKNYKEFFNKLMAVKRDADSRPNLVFNEILKYKINNIFSGHEIKTEEDLALMIYSTFLMTKAPYQRPVERANNLKGILNIQEYYDTTIGLNLTPKEVFEKTSVTIDSSSSHEKYIEKLFENDFNFDPKYCSNVGVFNSNYLESRGYKDELNTKWVNILNQCWDEISGSSGLRGDLNEVTDFWGQKGYFVVYKKLIKNEGYITAVKQLCDMDLDFDTKKKLVKQLNITFKDKIEGESEFLVFHAVDKVQWRGGREIYVMDMYTKTVQQPIEKFMGEVCKKMENELISIPSDRRAQVIHHSIFEKDIPTRDMLTWYLTLDCSKWAPKSNFYKFIPMLLSMDVIPPSFKTMFLNYTSKLFKKRIYFNLAEVEVLKNNEVYKSIVEKYLIKDDNVNGYYMLMPYSWVMGIFNYMSSFMHAANQRYASYLIFQTSIKNFNTETILVMFAHSDDSGGRVTAENRMLAKRALIIYEINLKCCNHILSKKKSVVSRLYFEILSIIYLFQRLLALLPKFLGGLRFLPTDKGASQDMLQSYSKCIEAVTAGATFNVAYLVMKFYSYMVFRFYYNEKPSIKDFEIPVQYTGLPDAHPISVLITGSEADIIRCLVSGGREKLKLLNSFVNKVSSTTNESCFIKPLKFEIKVRGIRDEYLRDTEDFSSLMSKWSIGNVTYHNTALNLITFLKKLSDPGFLGSMVNESQTRRIARAYYMRSSSSVITNYGKVNLKDFKDSLKIMLEYETNADLSSPLKKMLSTNEEFIRDEFKSSELSTETQVKVYEHISSSYIKIMKFLDKISLENKTIISGNRTLKPTHIEIAKTNKTFSVDFNSAQYVSMIKEPEMCWALSNPYGIVSVRQEVLNLINTIGVKEEDLDCETYLRLLRTYTDKTSKSIYIYSRVPSELKVIKTYTSLLTFLSVNSISGKEIQGLAVNVSGREVNPGYLTMDVNPETYQVNNLINLLMTLEKCCGENSLNDFNYLPIEEINWIGGTIFEFMRHLEIMESTNDEMMMVHIQRLFLKQKLNFGNEARVSGYEVKKGFFYTFNKTQKSKSGWYGKGQVMFYMSGIYFTFDLFNDSIEMLTTNFTGKLLEIHRCYIFDCLTQMGISMKQRSLLKPTRIKTKNSFGFDSAGNMCVTETRFITSGIPVEVDLNPPQIVRNLDFSEGRRIGNNTFMLEFEPTIERTSRKIYVLNVCVNDMKSVAQSFLDPVSFESKLMSLGLGNFEDFLYTEILTNYGQESYIGFNEFLDNFNASEIYKIFRKCQQNSWSKIPTQIMLSNMPAGETGMTRILIDYSNNSNEKILRTTGELTPEIMALRSEYPQETSVILSENLVKFHDKIYDISERNEIYESYSRLSTCDSIEEMSQNMGKLLRFWGYGSLVNVIEKYNLGSDEINYKYFKLSGYDDRQKIMFLDAFKNVNNILMSVMIDLVHLSDKMDYPFPDLYSRGCLKEILASWNCTMSMTTVNYITYCHNTDYDRMRFLNLLLGFMKYDEFTDRISDSFKKDLLLSSIPFDYKNRYNFIAMYNTLSLIRYRIEGNDNKGVDLNYIVKNDRRNSNRMNLIAFYKRVCTIPELTLHPTSTHYYGFINENFEKMLKEPKLIKTDSGASYRILNTIVNKSKDPVPMKAEFKFERPISDEYMEEDNWEEICCELNMEEVDTDTVNEIMEEIEVPKYKKLRTFARKYKSGLHCNLEINWVIDPYIEGQENLKFYRQCGENLVVLTNCYIRNFIESMPNPVCKLVSFKRTTGIERPMLAFCTSQYVNVSLWDEIVGGKNFYISEDVKAGLMFNLIRRHDGETSEIENIASVINPLKMGEKDSGIEDKEEIENENKLAAESSKTGGVIRLDKEVDEIEEIKSKITKMNLDGIISKRTMWRMIDKYCNSGLIKIFSMETLFKNCMVESELNALNSGIKKGTKTFDMNSTVKMFKAPEYFGLAHSVNRPQNNLIRSKKVGAELNSLISNLSEKVGSDTISMTKGMLKVCKATLKLWKTAMKFSNYKMEQKRFLTTLIISIINCAKISEENDPDIQELLNKCTVYIASDEDDDEEEGEEEFRFDMSLVPSSRLMYRSSNF